MAPRGYRVLLDQISFAPSPRSDRAVLDSVSLSIEPGVVVAVVGLNGAGKSSVLRAIAGELPHDLLKGNATVGGQPVDKPVGRIIDGVGVVHQREEVDVIDHLTVAQNIGIRQLLSGNSPIGFFTNTQRWRKMVAGILAEEANLPDFPLDTLVGNLCGGEKQMLSVALAIHLEHHNRPCRLLLLDEHTARLDHMRAERVMDYTIEQAKEAEATVIMVTHRYEEALRFAERIFVLRDGVLATPEGVSPSELDVDSLEALVERDL